MAEDSPHEIDLRRRRAVHDLHAVRYPASLTRGTSATTFIAVRPLDGGAVPCRIDLRGHGIEAARGAWADQGPVTGESEPGDAMLIPGAAWQRLDRATALRLFGLAGPTHGELVEDLGAALAQAWAAEGIGADLDGEGLAFTARSWEADRMARSGLADLRGLLPALFSEAAAYLVQPGMSDRGVFGDYAIDMLVRNGALCEHVASLGALAPLAMRRWDVIGNTPSASVTEFVHAALGSVRMNDGRVATLAESDWLLRTFRDVSSANITEDIATFLISYRRAIGFQELGQTDGAALGLALSFAGLAETDHAARKVLGLMGDLGATDGMPLAFLSGVKRHRDAALETTEATATKLATDALDLADAIWNAIGSQAAIGVAATKAPGVLPMLVWDIRDPAVQTFMDGVRRIATAATCQGTGSEGLLSATDKWVLAGRPGREAASLAGLGRRRTFREIEMAKDRAGLEREAILGFLAHGTGLDPRPELEALIAEVAAMGTGTQERWLRQDYGVSDPVGLVGNVAADICAPTVPMEQPEAAHAADMDASGQPEPDLPTGDDGDDAAGVAGPWWKRATTLGIALAAKRHA